LHSKLEPGSLEENEKLAEVDLVRVGGPLRIEVCGGAVSAASTAAEPGVVVDVGAGPEATELVPVTLRRG
jgi:hypothetical protein